MLKKSNFSADGIEILPILAFMRSLQVLSECLFVCLICFIPANLIMFMVWIIVLCCSDVMTLLRKVYNTSLIIKKKEKKEMVYFQSLEIGKHNHS